MTHRRVCVDCEPEAVRPWRLERVDDAVWITFDEGVPRPLGTTAEVMPALRRFLQEIGEADAVAIPKLTEGARII